MGRVRPAPRLSSGLRARGSWRAFALRGARRGGAPLAPVALAPVLGVYFGGTLRDSPKGSGEVGPTQEGDDSLHGDGWRSSRLSLICARFLWVGRGFPDLYVATDL